MDTRKQSNKSTIPLVALTPREVQHLVRPRPGFEQFADDLLSLYASNPSVFGTEIDVDAVRKALAAYTALRSQELLAKAHLDSVHETRLLNGSTVWSAMLGIYGHGTLAARTNALIGHGIADFAAFMKKKRKATTA
jgi:hypothetical protein